MEVKNDIWSRIEQSFILLFKKNTLIAIWSLLSIDAVYLILNYIYYLATRTDTIELNSWKIFSGLIFQWIILIWYLLLKYFGFIWTVKSISENINTDKITGFKEIFAYWFKNFWPSSLTYLHIFMYVYIIPAIIFIVWWLIVIRSFYVWDSIKSILLTIGLILWIISILVMIVSLFYRWTRSTFVIYSAIDQHDYSKESFNRSVWYTQNNFWRILWSMILFWLIIWTIVTIVKPIINIPLNLAANVISPKLNLESEDQEKLKTDLSTIWDKSMNDLKDVIDKKITIDQFLEKLNNNMTWSWIDPKQVKSLFAPTLIWKIKEILNIMIDIFSTTATVIFVILFYKWIIARNIPEKKEEEIIIPESTDKKEETI